MQRCAAWLAGHLQTSGLEHVRVVRMPRHPIVIADWLHAPAQLPSSSTDTRGLGTGLSPAFGAQTVFLRNGGAIPVVNLIQEVLGIPAVLMGFGLAG